jgi:hypothetical protein
VIHPLHATNVARISKGTGKQLPVRRKPSIELTTAQVKNIPVTSLMNLCEDVDIKSSTELASST